MFYRELYEYVQLFDHLLSMLQLFYQIIYIQFFFQDIDKFFQTKINQVRTQNENDEI